MGDFHYLDGSLWPDPDPPPQKSASSLRLNDVSGLSETVVEAIFYPQTVEDVQQVLTRALQQGKRVAVRGTSHSMGGHSLQEHGYCLDLRYLNHYCYNDNETTITAGTGCTWAQVIRVLNRYGKSPCVLQSYCNFSVGGTLSVNAHGITSDDCIAETVAAVHVVRYDENHQVVVTTCRPGDELFRLVLGGYGGFGILVEATLKVTDNTHLRLEALSSLRLLPRKDEQESEFERVWQACREDPTVEIKMGRINLVTLETASLYVFSNDCGNASTRSNLSPRPKTLSPMGRLLYKWALPILQDVRQAREEATGQALDFGGGSECTTRNEVLWESALALSKLYTPFLVVNDTFCLQEFFVPKDRFGDWIQQSKPVFGAIGRYQKQGNAKENVPPHSLMLLNTTIRFVNSDKTTFLAYGKRQSDDTGKDEQGYYAFVLYFRVRKANQVEQDLAAFHNQLAEISVGLGGSFYLPYRKCYSSDLLRRAYPNISVFAKHKEDYDPLGLFSNLWFERYVLELCHDSYQEQCKRPLDVDGGSAWNKHPKVATVGTLEEFMTWLPRIDDPLLERRNDSFRRLVQDRSLRNDFEHDFLTQVFNVEDPNTVMRALSRAARDPANRTDCDIYQQLYDHFQAPLSPLQQMKQGWRGLRQLRRQKQELVKETAGILHRLGMCGSICTYLSIGDHGKTVRDMLEAGVFQDEFQVFVAHKFGEADDENSIPAVMERGSLGPMGTPVSFDFVRDDPKQAFQILSTDNMDLVTINQGLHHFPPSTLFPFLKQMMRILRPGGVLLCREHDLRLSTSAGNMTNADVAMLDVAHMVFNAVTGVPLEDESGEVRAFRPLSEWRSILTSIGFVDTMLYGLEDEDCTYDFMMCFQKPASASSITSPKESCHFQPTKIEHFDLPIMQSIRALLSQVPSSTATFIASTVTVILQNTPHMKEKISRFLLHDLSVVLSNDDSPMKQSTSQVANKANCLILSWLDKLNEVAPGSGVY